MKSIKGSLAIALLLSTTNALEIKSGAKVKVENKASNKAKTEAKSEFFLPLGDNSFVMDMPPE